MKKIELKELQDCEVRNLKLDMLFKYVMIDPKDSYYVLRDIIRVFTGIKVKDITIQSPEKLVDSSDDKAMVLDILVTDEHNQYFNIEMQNSKYSRNERIRFQSYNCELVCDQLKKGENYVDTIRKVFQILFVDDKVGNRVVSRYQMREECGELLEDGLQTIIIVSLKNAEAVLKEASKLTEEEMYAKVFNNQISDDILKMNRGVRNMVDRIKEFNKDDMLRLAAIHRELKARAIELDKQEERANAKAEGIAEGKAEGIAEGKAEGIAEGKAEVCRKLMKKMNVSLEEIMDLLEIEDTLRPIIIEKLK